MEGNEDFMLLILMSLLHWLRSCPWLHGRQKALRSVFCHCDKYLRLSTHKMKVFISPTVVKIVVYEDIDLQASVGVADGNGGE